MSKNQQKDEWKKESEQLKKDLANRQKVVKKREVELSFGKRPSKNKAKNKQNISHLDDNHLRQSINWNNN